MNRVFLQSAYVLHRRAYRETSFLVELFTSDHGRLTVVAHGARQTRSLTQGLLQPFSPLLISWSGRGELMTLTQVEANGQARRLQGECLFAGFYLNELLMCLLQKWDAHPKLYEYYHQAMTALQRDSLEQKILRSFELRLLTELGYGLLWKSDADLQCAFMAEKYYRFVPEQGFIVSEWDGSARTKDDLFSGKSLLAIAKEDWREETSLRDAKRLMRFVFGLLLGEKSLHSRQLFRPVKKREQV
jgi:DNA repair protein RecO (recombination protein O)